MREFCVTHMMDHDESSLNERCSSLNILDLPDIFVIAVFKKLKLKNRLKIAHVCKKWNSLLKDSLLWTKIDLEPYKSELALSDLNTLIAVYGGSSTKYLKICGNFSQDKVTDNSQDEADVSNDEHQPIHYIDNNFLSNLTFKCMNVNTIILEHLDLSKLQLRSFFTFENLELFSLKWCYLGNNWFKPTSSDANARIKHLYLTRCSSDYLDKGDMEDLCKKLPDLLTLSIVQTRSTLTDEIIDLISKYCKNVENLELVNTLLSDNAIMGICQSVSLSTNLKHLNLSMSSSLSNNCISLISEHLKNLKSLNLTSCFGISNISLLQNLINLSYLNINNTSLDKNKIRELLLPVLSHCEIDFGHEKMLNRKLMWTINGSRNCVCSF